MIPGRPVSSLCIHIAHRIIWATLILCPCLTAPVSAASVPRVLVLNSYNTGYDWSDAETRGLRSGLAKVYARQELFVEQLDTKRFHDKPHFPRLADLLEAKYRDARLDVIIAMDNAALEFATRYRQRLFPNIPLVFCGGQRL